MKNVRLAVALLTQVLLAACSGSGIKSPDQASFVLSGNLSGLASGQSLVLADAAGSNVTLTSDGAFRFTGRVLFGASYDVTVVTQPAGQSCAISGNSSGTAIQSDVSNLVVTCTTSQFTIGGTLSGLSAGTSVVVDVNGANPLSLTGNGAFVFTQPIDYGASYTATIQTQPTGQTCSLADNTGSGSGVNHDVTNVQVVCSGTTYSIGGTVIGLDSGKSLTLYDSGSNPLSLQANGSFTFSQPVAAGGSYQVIVGTQPMGETCSIANSTGSGIGVTANITDVTIICSSQAFTIGGAVSGLAGGQNVTLLDNGGDALTLAGNGQFSFANGIAYGGSYAVTVSGQPLGQTCSVANASGTNVAAAVNSLLVTCTGSTYSIGGAVSGLASSESVTLLDNGFDALTLTADGSFTFGTGLAVGSSYDVSVAREPTGQVCTINNGSGTVTASNVTAVSVSCTTSSASNTPSGTYTIGGTVAGLTSGASLVLRNSSDGDTVAVNASGAFTFPIAEASGASYSVSVEQASSGVNCTVNAGSGVLAAANVASIAVSCTTSGSGSGPASSSNAFTVGGTVSGLPTGDVLVLRNSADGDTVTVSASGVFSFPTAEMGGTSYFAWVETQPNAATCLINDGSGTVGTSNVTTIAVVCTPNSSTSNPLYTIGGSVSGLQNGASVVLADSGNGDQAVVVSNGAFAFPISEPSGFAYVVTVQSAPSGETCTISGGAGNVGLGNVTGVLVTCSSNSTTYTVGGSVNWSAGASGTFTVSLGGANTVTVTSPTRTFTFPSALAAGSNYVATITTEPSGSTCYIASGTAGYSISADVSGIAIDCSQQLTTYPMNVTVSGLPTSDEAYLELNGITSSTPFPNGTTPWPTNLTGGEFYTIAVAQVYNKSTLSADATVTCSVSNGAFTVSGSVAENVTCGSVSYSVSGTVNGLPPSSTSTPYSVTLYESGRGDYLTVDGCTSCSTSSSVAFTFPQSLANGAIYNVTVATQPSLGTINCTVANASGTISGANVTNVGVTCPAPTWSVGGTVSGLPSGESVGLKDTDSGSSVTVTNASSDTTYPGFTIDRSDATNASYSIVVDAAPPNYTCTVANGVGTVPVSSNGGEVNANNVQVTCAHNPLNVGGTVTWENTQSTAANNLNISLLLSGQYATNVSANVPGATSSNGSTTNGTALSTFTFSQSLAYGSAWAVSVQSVTSGWTCQLTNASGTSITASVTNVQVTCTN